MGMMIAVSDLESFIMEDCVINKQYERPPPKTLWHLLGWVLLLSLLPWGVFELEGNICHWVHCHSFEFLRKTGQSGKNCTPSCVNQPVVHLARALSLLTPDSRRLGSPSAG